MRIQSLLTSGWLDVSAQEILGDESEQPFRLCLAPGEIVHIPDKWATLDNIVTAVTDGALAILSYDSSPPDIFSDGVVLKDDAIPPHYWRVGVDSDGNLEQTDLGTTPPTT